MAQTPSILYRLFSDSLSFITLLDTHHCPQQIWNSAAWPSSLLQIYLYTVIYFKSPLHAFLTHSSDDLSYNNNASGSMLLITIANTSSFILLGFTNGLNSNERNIKQQY